MRINASRTHPGWLQVNRYLYSVKNIVIYDAFHVPEISCNLLAAIVKEKARENTAYRGFSVLIVF